MKLFWNLTVYLSVVFSVLPQDFPLEKLKSWHKDLEISFNPLTSVAEIRKDKILIRFMPDENFYIVNSYIVPIETSAKIKNGKIYLSAELVEEIFSELNLPLKYRFHKEKLQVEKTEPITKIGWFPQIIVIDAGHGGHDPGAFGALDTVEKEITLKVSLFLARKIKENFPHTKVVLTRKKDVFLSLSKRSEIANQYFDHRYHSLFLSIHCNATLSPKIGGFEIYHLAINPQNKASRETELRENLIQGDVKIRELTSRLINAQIQHESKLLARTIEKALREKLKGIMESRGVRKADFAVLRASLMPAVLIELGYISNPKEANVLKSPSFLKIFSEAIIEAIRLYSQSLP